MSIVIITGAAGLIGSEAVAFFARKGFDVVGIDNDMRRVFFGQEASIAWNRDRLQREWKHQYTHYDLDIRDEAAIFKLFARYGQAIELVIHAAAQPSHDWAAREPMTDFSVNATGTLNLLEATRLHGFLAYLMKCTVTGTPYTVFGYKGKQVRDNIHSADLIQAFDAFYGAPRVAEVYNIGGSRYSNCSMLEAIQLCQEISGRDLTWQYTEENRKGDHLWWIGDVGKFAAHYPGWRITYDVPAILREIYETNVERWRQEREAAL